MSEIVLAVGNDNGNSEHDIIINGKLIKQPNVYAKVRKLPNFDEVNKNYVLKNIEDNLVVICEEPNGIYYIGNYALGSGQRVRSIEVGVDNNKIEDDIVMVNTLAQIAGYAVAEHFKEHGKTDEIIKAKVDMTTSLPVTYYKHKTATEFANKFLDKTHMVTVNVGNSKVRVEIEFTFVKTIPEGVTATFALREANEDLFEEYNKEILSNSLKIDDSNNNSNPISKSELLNNKFFKNAKVLHVAIGEGTTEYPITKGIEFDPNFIKGTNNGVGHAIDKALDEFKGEKGLLNFTRQDYSRIIRDKSHKFHNSAMDIVEQYIEEEAEEILHNIKREIQKANNEIDIVVVYGGGSILMRKSLESKLKAFCNRAEIKLLYIPEKYAVTLEAEGLYNFTTSKIFGALKAKYNK